MSKDVDVEYRFLAEP
ncbi:MULTISPECIES: DUF2627 domain-containing protein [unclassified Pantoea]|nr:MULTISPECIES: DUF2627 domain-containing protein [unclassified Pantoea]